MVNDQVGSILDDGASDWQVFQQDGGGVARIALRGRWVSDLPGTVQVRLVDEDTGVAVNGALDWQSAVTDEDHTWSAVLAGVPAGGLYRLETRFNQQGNVAGEWSVRGDMRHFLGVGDLWVITGQSNAAGYGRGPVHDPPELGVHVFRNSECWALATHPLNESTDTCHPVNRENANSGHSSYLHFGRLLKNALGHPIGLVQAALGGSALSAWNPAEVQPAVLFDNMRHVVARAGGVGVVKGILWYQGETDANPQDGASYARRFTAAVGAWREALHDARLPVITVQLNRVLQPVTSEADLGWSLVREAQRQVARGLPNVAVVPALDLPLSDGIHNSPAGNMLLADRLARAALGMVYGLPVDHLAPDAQTASRLDGGSVLEVTFANVKSRMDCIDPAAVCFTVQDEQGAVPVTQVTYTGGPAVRLALGRTCQGRAVVHGACGINPPVAPADMERFLPMLAFHGLEVA